MRINTRFPVAVHIMALAALARRPATSQIMAKSVNTNPVVIRRIIAMLKKAGLVQVRAGVGGTVLLRPPQEITLLDIYNAVKEEEDAPLFDVHPNPNPLCYVGANILDLLADPLADAQNAMEERLATHSLQEIVIPLAKKREEMKARNKAARGE